MRYFATYLVYAAVAARAAGWSQDNTPIPLPAWILFFVFGALLFTQRAATGKWPGYPRLYIPAQSALVVTMLYIAPQVDIFPMLFLPLSFQAVQYLSLRFGIGCIAAFSAAMAGMLLLGMEAEQWSVMLLFSTGANAAMGGFALLIRRTEASRGDNQRQLAKLQAAYRILETDAIQAEALAAAEERQRVVRELHDSLTQTLFSMNLAVQAAKLAADQSPDQVAVCLRRLKTLAASAVGEVRALSGQAPAADVAQEGLSSALRRLAAEWQSQGDFNIALFAAGERKISAQAQSNLYHIAREALNNVFKHSSARRVTVRLDLTGIPATLEITDDGRGFIPSDVRGCGGIGLDSMAGRAREIGWEWTIETALGKGTRIEVREKPV